MEYARDLSVSCQSPVIGDEGALQLLRACEYDAKQAVDLIRPVPDRLTRAAAVDAQLRMSGRSGTSAGIPPTFTESSNGTRRSTRARITRMSKEKESPVEDFYYEPKEERSKPSRPASESQGPIVIDPVKDAFAINGEICCICRDGGNIICCESDSCGRSFHLDCYGFTQVPSDDWKCRAHFCGTCDEVVELVDVNQVRYDINTPNPPGFPCQFCSRVYCANHLPDISTRENYVSDALCDACAELTTTDKAYFDWHLSSFHRAVYQKSLVPADLAIHGRTVDLFILYNTVIDLGGVDHVGFSFRFR
jgi:hypothetical protein